MKLSSLLFEGEFSSPYDPQSIEIGGICCAGDRVTDGCLFVCIRGTRYDSHLLLQKVAAAGAAAALIEDGADYTAPEGFPVFSVANTRRALAFACDRFCGRPTQGMHLIGVTGTNGKTSTAAMIYRILSASGKSVACIGTVACKSEQKSYDRDPATETRTTMTTPDPDILYPMLKSMKEDGIEYVVMEASSHALALDKLAPLYFDVGIFTNLSPEHLDFHGTMENYLAAKARLFSQCKYGILNFDSEYAEKIAKAAPCRILRCGAVYHEEYNAEEIRNRGAEGSLYVLSAPGLRLPVSVPIPGSFSVYNSLLALCCSVTLGISPTLAAKALEKMKGVPGRLERLPLAGAPFSVFIDYAHTEAALRNLLSTVSHFRRSGERIVLLFGCGGDRDKGKRAPIGRVAEEYADEIILTSDNSRTEEPIKIIHDILQGMKNRSKRTVIVNRRRAIEHAIMNAQAGDIILLVGKGHETYELVGGERKPFDEKEIVRLSFEKRQKEKGVL
ncbi:MAG: UDP-N-acetylmuramoyl-L-alanyl-D-glutamate--2,6-diaminopimelate ligase [Clostridia bacterium]|nr:UDP-N-acetylmuramoyl-L-alanyl-D-glutamate--2,6-diaminopimelate ligase [Clostridia bacterium]